MQKNLFNIVELGSQFISINQLVSVYPADGKTGYGIVMDYGNSVLNVLGYPDEKERNRNMKRIESWLLEYPTFISIQNRIVNLSKFLFAQCVDKMLKVQMKGRADEFVFETEKEAKDAFDDLGGITNAKRR